MPKVLARAQVLAPAAGYIEQNRAGCVYELSATGYNFCRFDDKDFTERKLYGVLKEGSNSCYAVALVFNQTLGFDYTVKVSEAFEVYDFLAQPTEPTSPSVPTKPASPDSAYQAHGITSLILMISMTIMLINL